MIQVADVVVSSAWYQAVLGLVSAHGGDEFEILTADGHVVMQLHRWEAHEHALLGSPDVAIGNGVSLWFETDRFDEAVTRALTHVGSGTPADGPRYNPLADHRELTLQDPDGYVVVINSPFGDRGEAAPPPWAVIDSLQDKQAAASAVSPVPAYLGRGHSRRRYCPGAGGD